MTDWIQWLYVIVLIKVIEILIMLARFATSGLHKVTAFGNQGYDNFTYIDDVMSKDFMKWFA